MVNIINSVQDGRSVRNAIRVPAASGRRTLREQVDILQAQAQENNRKIEAAEARHAVLIAQIQRLEALAAAHADTIEASRYEIKLRDSFYRLELEGLEESLAAAEGEANRTRARLASCEAEADALKGVVHERNGRIALLEHHLRTVRNRSVGAAATIREQGEELLRLRRDLAEQRARCRELEARVAAAESSHDELERVRAQLGAQSERLAESLHIEARLRAALAHSEAAVRSARRETARREEAAAALERQFAKHLRGEIAAIDVELLCFDEMNGVIRTSKFTKLGNMLAPGVAAPALAGFAACALLLYGVLAVLHRTLAF